MKNSEFLGEKNVYEHKSEVRTYFLDFLIQLRFLQATDFCEM